MLEKIQTTNYDTLYTLYGLRVTDLPVYVGRSSMVDDLVLYFSKHLSNGRFPIDFDAKLQQAIVDQPELPEFRNYRIVYLGECGLIEEAIEASRDLIRDFPDYLFAHTGLAQLLITRNELAEAADLLGSPIHIETLEGKQEVYHESAVHSYYSAAALLALAHEDTELAEEYLPILILTRPNHSITRHLVIQIRKQKEASSQRAMEHDEKYERIVDSFPTVDYDYAEEPPTLQHAELEVFYHTEIETIDAETIAAIQALPRATLRTDLEAILIDSIQRYDYFTETFMEESEYCAPLHAFYWLGALDMEESLPLVLDWMRQGEEFIDFWTIETPIDILFDSFYPIAKNRLPDLLAYIKEPNQCEAARTLAATVVAKVGLEEEDRRAEAVEWFREVARHTVANVSDDALIDTRFLATWAFSVIDFQGTELWSEIQELYALDLIPWEEIGELRDIKKDIFEKNRIEGVIGNYALSLARTYGKGFSYEDFKLPLSANVDPQRQKWKIILDYTAELYKSATIANKLAKSVKPVNKPQYKASLNAPCPCGSGKKFKRCHGMQ